MRKAYLLVEGHGEVAAAGNLVSRVSQALGCSLVWSKPLRWKNLHQRRGLEKGVHFIRQKPDADALLLLRDEDDACPKETAPLMARWLEESSPPFPIALVLLHPEYEVLFLPCLDAMAGKSLGGRPGLLAGTRWDGANWEVRRGVKEWLTSRFPAGKAYKPVLDQLAMTRMIDLDVLRRAEVPCFGTMERAVAFLDRSVGSGAVYPVPSPSGGTAGCGPSRAGP